MRWKCDENVTKVDKIRHTVTTVYAEYCTVLYAYLRDRLGHRDSDTGSDRGGGVDSGLWNLRAGREEGRYYTRGGRFSIWFLQYCTALYFTLLYWHRTPIINISIITFYLSPTPTCCYCESKKVKIIWICQMETLCLKYIIKNNMINLISFQYRNTNILNYYY